MAQIKLTILASDIQNTHYLDKNCAVTLSLKRAGLSGYEDVGTCIIKDDGSVFVGADNNSFNQLATKVLEAYADRDNAKDFTHILKY